MQCSWFLRMPKNWFGKRAARPRRSQAGGHLPLCVYASRWGCSKRDPLLEGCLGGFTGPWHLAVQRSTSNDEATETLRMFPGSGFDINYRHNEKSPTLQSDASSNMEHACKYDIDFWGVQWSECIILFFFLEKTLMTKYFLNFFYKFHAECW